MEIFNPDLEKEILGIQAQIRRTEFNVQKIIDERLVREVAMQIRIVPDEPKHRMSEREFAFWSLFMGFVLGCIAGLLASNW